MHVCLLKIKRYIYLKLNEVLNVFISREGEREIEKDRAKTPVLLYVYRYVSIQFVRKIYIHSLIYLYIR